jgi:hypothetical protein
VLATNRGTGWERVRVGRGPREPLCDAYPLVDPQAKRATRSTYGVSSKPLGERHAGVCRIRRTKRVTPALAVGANTDHLWGGQGCGARGASRSSAV